MSGSVMSGSEMSGSVGFIHSRSSSKFVGLQISSGSGSGGSISGSIGGPGTVVVVVVPSGNVVVVVPSGNVVVVVPSGNVVVVVPSGNVVVVVGSVVVVVGQSTVKLGPQRFQPPEKELEVVEVLYLHLTFCPLGTFTDPLSELPGATG